jgi:hypothetical protein
MQTTLDGRVYQLQETDTNGMDNLAAHLIKSGYDGKIYAGISSPVGRQRKTFKAVFIRTAETGKFETLI